MKIEWQAEDVIPGRVVGNPARAERWMIGYFAGRDPGPSNRVFTLISLSDGMVQEAMSADALAAKLNGAHEVPVEMLDSPQARGGRARAASMSRAQRSAQASAAAKARWNGNPDHVDG